ncbi:hypothetical protein OEZ86_007196 [Tetradesmus obliquus]|nr:hypothetical protein OEZ86_007196 [Tetradesmus obliquus]
MPCRSDRLQGLTGQNPVGLSPLHVAAAAGRVDVLEWLSWAGCNVNQQLQIDVPLADALPIAMAAAADSSSSEATQAVPGSAAAAEQQQQQQQQEQQAKRLRRCDEDGLLAKAAAGSSSNSICHLVAAALDGHPQQQQQQQEQRLQQQQRLLLPADAIAGWALSSSTCYSLGCTALHVAAYYGQVEALQAMVQLPGVDVNAANAQGWTALHVAASLGHEAPAARRFTTQPPAAGGL